MNAPIAPVDESSDAPFDKAQGGLYAAQRARGFRRLRFEPGLEREYRNHMRVDQRMSTLVCAVTALGIWVAFMILDLIRVDLGAALAAGHDDILAVIALRWFTLSLLVLLVTILARTPRPPPYHWLTVVVLVMIGATATISANVFKLRGLPHADLAEFAIIMAVFLPVGLRFPQSVTAALLIVIATTISGLAMLKSVQLAEHLRLSSLLLFAAFVGAVGAFLREHAQRDQFLLQRILHHNALLDPLTGIGNRRHFEEQAAASLSQARRDGQPLLLAILDIDHFKRFNDRYGHYAGDLALRMVAQAVKRHLQRPLDFVSRLGGEEFGIVLYGADPQQAGRLLEGIVAAVAELAIPHETSPTAPHLTVSIGAASFDGRETLENLYRRADAVLYECKADGRNQAGLDWPDTVLALAARKPQTLRRG